MAKTKNIGDVAENTWKQCNFCGKKSPDISTEVFLDGEEVIRYYEVCPVCLSNILKRIIEYFMEEDDYKVNNIVVEVMDEIYCDIIHGNKMDDIDLDEKTVNVYNVKRK